MNENQTTERTTEVVESDHATRPVAHNRSVWKATQIIWYIAGVIVTLLIVRAILALLGANLENAFANFIYVLSDPFVAPFRGLLQVGEFQAGVSRLEIETLLAALVYTLIAWGIAKAVELARK